MQASGTSVLYLELFFSIKPGEPFEWKRQVVGVALLDYSNLLGEMPSRCASRLALSIITGFHPFELDAPGALIER